MHDRKVLAFSGDKEFRFGRARISAQIAKFALDCGARRRHPILGKFRRDDSGMRRPAAMKSLRPASIGHEFKQPACLAASDPNCDAQLLGVQPEQGARRGGGPSAPVVPVGWKPRAFVADGCKAAAPRQATSNPATIAVTNRLPLIPRSSASARLGENTNDSLWIEPGKYVSSSSMLCAAIPLAKAAQCALTRSGRPRSVAPPGIGRSAASLRSGWLESSVEACIVISIS